jgi:hypothetical protein
MITIATRGPDRLGRLAGIRFLRSSPREAGEDARSQWLLMAHHDISLAPEFGRYRGIADSG